MSVINQITSPLITKLAGGSTSSNGSSKINGKGASSSFGGDAVSLSASLKNLAIAFRDSDTRLLSPITVFRGTKQILAELHSVGSELIDLAKRAAKEETSTEERGNLNTSFQDLIQKYQSILDGSTINDIDLRDKNDLAKTLSDAGIDLSATTDLAKAFSALAPADAVVGHSLIASEDVVVVAHDGSVEVGRANGSTDPLLQNIQTRSGATIAYNTLLKLQDDLESDQGNVDVVIKELRGADNFSIAGNTSSVELLDETLSSFTAEDLASELIRRIKSLARDNNISQHSDLDTTLVKQLIS